MFRASAANLFVRCRSAQALREFSAQPFKPMLSAFGGIFEKNEVSSFGVNKRYLSTTSKMFAAHQPLTLKTVKDRIMLNLCLFDKIDPEKLTFDSDLFNDMGLDSLDFVEVICYLEDDFNCEIPDGISDRLRTPSQIYQFLCDKLDVIE